MRLIDADRLLSDKMKSAYYHLPNGDTAIPIIDIEHAPTVGETTRPVFNGRFWECEKCGEMYQDILEVRKYRHCPWCGRRFE